MPLICKSLLNPPCVTIPELLLTLLPLVAGHAPSASERALDRDVANFIHQAYAPSTRSAYATHRRSYLAFCQVMGYTPVPASSSTLCRYAAVLARTLKLLIQILSKLDLNRLEDAAFWASLLLMFFAMLRVSSVLCKVTSCDHSRHLIPSDLHFHHKGMDLTVRSTKTIQFQGRRLIYPFRKSSADTVLCPIKAVVLYLALSPPLPPSGPLFVSSGSGQPLTATTLATRLKTILKDLGITAGVISCHSARRGGACLAYKLQIPIDTIRLIGDWRSNCYMKYIEVESPLVGKALHNMVSNALQS